MSMKADIICSDEELLRTLSIECEESGWTVSRFSEPDDFLSAHKDESPPAVILVLGSGTTEDGLAPMKAWHEEQRSSQLVLLMPQDLPGGDRLALHLGARHSLWLPHDSGDLRRILAGIAEGLGRRRIDEAVRERQQEWDGAHDILGTSRAIAGVMSLAAKVASSETTSVMITGENGTGKGSLAQAIHRMSSRAQGPFIEVNCAAIPSGLLESEFFGYEKGAFTDAKQRKMGLFECADGGSIFLDEVGEIDYNLQAKLLKFLDSRTIRRISGTQFLPVDVRIIAATNRDLHGDVQAGRFRADLFYRLNVVEIELPPLRERAEDIRPIAVEYAKRFSRRLKKGDVRFAEDALELLERYPWPGNIRELINLVERAVLLSTSEEIHAGDLPIAAPEIGGETICHLRKESGTIRIDLPPEGIKLDELERSLIVSTLVRAEGNITRAADLLGIERGTLRYKMKKHGISVRELKEKLKNGEYEPVSVTD
ncbi:MAG: sigma-54 dependent transcriptional regulator [Candidatus Krumholzibacteria bacterium]|nr:sigma-54 dependent transcriptional regulator [Candidatus Krumholzibacteria bacterium]